MSKLSEVTGLDVHERGPIDGPRAVMIHSTGVNGVEMVDRFGLAVPGYHILAPDRTNYGQSRRSQPGGSGRSNGNVPEVALVEDDAEDIAKLLGRGGHLFGYSYGAIVALKIASSYPALVHSLTLLEAPAFQLVPDDADSRSTLSRITAGLGKHFNGPSEYFAAYMSSAFGETFRMPLDLVPLERKAAAMREQMLWDVELDLAPIKEAGVPALVICGDWDPGFVAVSKHLATQLSGRFVQFAHASHFFDGHWAAINDEIEMFWHRPAGGVSARPAPTSDDREPASTPVVIAEVGRGTR